MVVGKFTDLAALNAHLAESSYVAGFLPSQDDVTTSESVHNGLDESTYPHVGRWLRHIMSFTDFAKAGWGGAAAEPAAEPADEAVTAEPVAAEPVAAEPVAAKEPAAEIQLSDIVEVVIPAEVTPTGSPEYITYNNDACIGKKFPSLDGVEYITDAGLGRPEAGKPFLLILWAQFHKPGFPTLAKYSTLNAKMSTFNQKLPFVALSVDPSVGSPKKYLEDPAKKYSTKFPLTFSVAHDSGLQVKGALTPILDASCTIPHMFLVDGEGTIVWHQDHAQIGSTAADHMDMVESQACRLLAGIPLQDMGDRPVEVFVEEDDEEDQDPAMAEKLALLAANVSDEDGEPGESNY